MDIFSEQLRILDRNSYNLMIDDMREEIRKKDSQIQEKDNRIQELEKQVQELRRKEGHQHLDNQGMAP